MTTFRADLHIHTVLSPCGSLEMSPKNIVAEASGKGIGIIGITDHNSTRHCRLAEKIAGDEGIFVMKGAEVTTREEVHCLVFFENFEKLEKLQELLDSNLPAVLNNPDLFGDQVQVDEDENIVYSEEKMLTNATGIPIEYLEEFTHANGGIFIPAHIDRLKNSIYSQLGFIPADLKADALELSSRADAVRFATDHPETGKFAIVRNSDAHFPGAIGTCTTVYEIEKPSFSEILMALRGEKGRRIAG